MLCPWEQTVYLYFPRLPLGRSMYFEPVPLECDWVSLIIQVVAEWSLWRQQSAPTIASQKASMLRDAVSCQPSTTTITAGCHSPSPQTCLSLYFSCLILIIFLRRHFVFKVINGNNKRFGPFYSCFILGGVYEISRWILFDIHLTDPSFWSTNFLKINTS